MDELSTSDYLIVDHFVRTDIYADLRAHFLFNLPSFTKAGIGAQNENVVHHDVRGDHTYWLDRQRDLAIESFWCLVDETINIFNRYCFLSLSDSEFHFANYPPRTKYERHLDQFNNRSNRMITVIIYLNEDWQKGDGGELEIFLKDGSSKIIEPVAARCIMFKSANIPHRVLKSNKDRYSLTGWLLYQPASLGQFLG
jgi:SM-20-related protein